MILRSNAWIAFVFIGALFILFALYNLFYIPALDPADPDEGWLWLTSEPAIIDYIKFYFRLQGLWQIPLAVFVIFTAVGGLRRGQRWAWYACWCVPIHFVILATMIPWLVPILAPLFLLAVGALILMLPIVRQKSTKAA